MNFKKLIERSEKYLALNDKNINVIYQLIEEVFKVDKVYVLSNLDQSIEEKQLEDYSELLSEYLFNDRPIEYVLGYKYFYDLKFKINENVLIPRNETEELVEKTLNILEKDKEYKILDLGTGSGVIGLSLAKNLPVAKVSLSDICKDALNVAKHNAKELKLDVEIVNTNLLDYFIEKKVKFDVIISNPPYIAQHYPLDKNVLQEPHKALFAQEEGTYFYRKILEDAHKVLNSNYKIFFEVGYDQADKVANLAKKNLANSKITILKDINKIKRFVIIESN